MLEIENIYDSYKYSQSMPGKNRRNRATNFRDRAKPGLETDRN